MATVSGSTSAATLAALASAGLVGAPATFAPSTGALSVETSSGSVSGVLGALTYFSASAKANSTVDSVQAAEWTSWAARTLLSGSAVSADTLKAVEQRLQASAPHPFLAGAAASVADVAVAAAVHSGGAAAAPGADAPLTAALVANITGQTYFKAAVKTMASEGQKRKAPEGGAGAAAAAAAEGAAATPAAPAAGKEKAAKGAKTPGAGGAGGAGASGLASAEAVMALAGYTTAATVDTSDSAAGKAQMSVSVIHELTAVFTKAIHAAFPHAAALGQGPADVAGNAIGKFVHHYQCNSALSLYARLKSAAGGDAAKKEKKAAKTKEGAQPGGAEAAAAAEAASPALALSPAAPAYTGPPAPASPVATAQAIIDAVTAAGPHYLIGRLELSGPGYINIYLAHNYVLARLAHIVRSGPQCGPAYGDRARKVAIDYSSPNIAKDMHIGHLRSTIIGDALARILEFCGHEVKRINHVGDWGTQFGMLLAHLKEMLANGTITDSSLDASISDLTAFYKAAKKRFDEDADFKKRAHLEVVALQAGDATNKALWLRMVKVSESMFQQVYSRLNVDKRLELCGESFYNPLIPPMIAELEGKGLCTVNNGALVLAVEGQKVPLMVRKSDGGYGYDSTDMAAIKYRLQQLDCDWLLYVIDAGQSLHMDLVFAGARAAGWYVEDGPGSKPEEVAAAVAKGAKAARVYHVGFGVVQGEDRKKFKTRSGETVRLVDVLEEARSRAGAIIAERVASGNSSLSPEEAANAAAVLGYGGVKYFDLKQNRITDYVFDWDRMLSPDGDTAVYLQYACARVASILRKARESLGVDVAALATGIDASGAGAFTFTHPSELTLVADLMRLQEVLCIIQLDLMPHRLCEYIYVLAGKVTDFLRDCHVLGETTPVPLRESRLRLLLAVQQVMGTALRLLGINPLERI